MSPTAPAPSSNTTTEYRVLDGRSLRPNPWNPNRMTDAMYAKAKVSIQTFGLVDTLLVRELGPFDGTKRTMYEIINGEHRWRAASDLGFLDFPCLVVSGLSDPDAKKLTIIMNELHGQADPDKMGDLLASILADTSLEELLTALPYDESILAGFLQLPALPPLETAPPASPAEAKTTWVERLYRMPKEAALVLDEAIEKAADGEKLEPWQGLERVAADYLAS